LSLVGHPEPPEPVSLPHLNNNNNNNKNDDLYSAVTWRKAITMYVDVPLNTNQSINQSIPSVTEALVDSE